jgi:ubiquinone/menaquinone biosynthesis C-methylase UbiE
MSHSQLLELREQLRRFRNIDPVTLVSARSKKFEQVKDIEITDEEIRCELGARLILDNIELEKTNSLVENYVEELDEIIMHQVFDFIRKDNIHYSLPGTVYKTAYHNRNYQDLKISNDTADIVRSRIGTYTDWRYPGLEIGPGDGVWTRNLVACDPLYIVDHNDEFLVTTKGKFNEQYQNRLRCYLNNSSSLYMLPQNQFGFVFSWNTFNYLSFNQINQYLREIYNVLRPGGACMFSYNNGERALCAERSENHLMSFIPETILRKVVRARGFIDIETTDLDSSVSWIEFRKPGSLASSRTGQTLGKIILKHHVKG